MRSSERVRCSTEGAERGRLVVVEAVEGKGFWLVDWLVSESDVDDGCRMSDVGKREAGVRGMEGGCGVRCAGARVWVARVCARYGLWRAMLLSGSDDSDERGKDGEERPERYPNREREVGEVGRGTQCVEWKVGKWEAGQVVERVSSEHEADI